jgi:phosphoglycolate phosphatase-like HAD superfamily hydrolase
MLAVRHLVWDWNGTLLDDLPLIVEAANAALGAFGAAPISVAEYRDRFTRPVLGFYRWALGREVDAAEAGVIDRAFFDHYHARVDGVGLNSEALDAVGEARRRGATQSVLSMWWHDRLVPAVERLGLGSFMVAVDGLRGAAGESKEQHLGEHLELLGELLPEIGDVVLIGDVTDDAVAAAAGRIGCVLVDTGSQSRRVLETTGRPVVSSLCAAVDLALADPSV